MFLSLFLYQTVDKIELEVNRLEHRYLLTTLNISIASAPPEWKGGAPNLNEGDLNM